MDDPKDLDGEMFIGEGRSHRGKFNTAVRKRDRPRAFGVSFDSKLERDRALFLKAEEQRGAIMYLQFHPRFTLLAAFTDRFGERHRKMEYAADFSYVIAEGSNAGIGIVEDVKGGRATQTATFRLKRKLFCRLYPRLKHRIVTNPTEPVGQEETRCTRSLEE